MLRPIPERLAIEVTAAALRAVRLGGFGPAHRVRAYAERPLPPGLLMPSGTVPNVRDEAAFGRLLAEVVGPAPPRRARLVLPDRSVRLHVFPMDALPRGVPDLRGFLLWRLEDVLPFPPREARLAYLGAPNGLPTRQLAIAVVAREQVLAQYERLLRGRGLGAAHVAPAACHLFNLAVARGHAAGDAVEALLGLGPEAATVILARRAIPQYARTFPRPEAHPAPPSAGSPSQALPPEASLEGPQAVKALAEEVLRSVAHAAETGDLPAPTRLALAGEVEPGQGLAHALQEILGIPCGIVQPPVHRSRQDRPLPTQAWALLTAASARL
jgi:Tfp pilus assembly PilM family ATPase